MNLQELKGGNHVMYVCLSRSFYGRVDEYVVVQFECF